jgi:hypothetical protein
LIIFSEKLEHELSVSGFFLPAPYIEIEFSLLFNLL